MPPAQHQPRTLAHPPARKNQQHKKGKPIPIAAAKLCSQL